MSEAIESAQPKTATVEDFPIGSRWRKRSGETKTVCARRDFEAQHGPPSPGADVFFRDVHGFHTQADSGYVRRFFTRLDDHPAPPPVAEPAAPVPMVGDIVRNEQGDELVVTRVIGTGSEWPIGLQRVRDGAPMIGAKDAEQLYRTCAFVRRAQPQPAAPARPAPMCEAPGWLGRAHAVDATEYGTCRVCGASAGDRRAARRRVFDADEQRVRVVFVSRAMAAPESDHREDYWRALYKPHENRVAGTLVARAPTRELAVEALWTRLEAERA